MSFLALAPDAALAVDRPYPERADDDAPWHDRAARWLADAAFGPLQRRLAARPARLQCIVALTDARADGLATLSDARLRQRVQQLRPRLRRALTEAHIGESFALIREAAGRTLGKRHYPCQLMAGLALLQGRLAEMATGEGKTFAATLAAGTMALAGHPVHVITVNDYLAARDADEMGPLYTFLGLSVGSVVQGLPRSQRRAAYACAVTYCTNKEIAFDYLRDGVAAQGRGGALRHAVQRLGSAAPGAADDGAPVLRGLVYAIVDEADSVFIDEARTPLILSALTDATEEARQCGETLALARTLQAGVDFTVDAFRRSVTLSDAGRAAVEAHAQGRSGWWISVRAREERVAQALSALHLFQRDRHYVVTQPAVADDGNGNGDGNAGGSSKSGGHGNGNGDGNGGSSVQIVDESTGRVMPDRSWERGLHQFIEAKEGVALTQRRETLARLTYQRLLRRYLLLAGMSGTAVEVAGEIRSVYRLQVARIPLHRPSRRRVLPPTLCVSQAEKWARVADVAAALSGAGRPVLVGTRSVQASEDLSAVLHARGIDHALLNAKQDGAEADVIASAGSAGRVTVATNMAGRGTDIRLADGVADRGGLHVVLTEHHESRRIDRQLFGRCARQHDPGSCQAIVALDDELFGVCVPRTAALLARWLASGGAGLQPAGRLRTAAHGVLRWLAQRSAEQRNARIRVQNMQHDRRLHQTLAFTGRGE